MNIPKKITVFGKEITITIVKDLRGLKNCIGCYIPKSGQILIDEELTKDKDKELLKITLLHEIMHSMVDRLSFHDAGLTHEMEEMLVDNIAKLMTESLNWRFK